MLLLAVFALSNTPTRYLHKLFANHTDFESKQVTDYRTPQLSVAGIDCHCNSNVVIAPYTLENAPAQECKIPEFAGFIIALNTQLSLSKPITFGLRGPPSIA